MGRSRNKGNKNSKPERDKRSRLYIEYLKIIADLWPPVFVMENVPGLLSSAVQNQRMFERILADLQSPAEAVPPGRTLVASVPAIPIESSL